MFPRRGFQDFNFCRKIAEPIDPKNLGLFPWVITGQEAF